MKCRMGPGNKAKKGTHVQMQGNVTSKTREREKPQGKTLPQKEVSTNMLKKMKKGRNASTRPPKDKFCNPKHRPQLKIVWQCKRFGEDVRNLRVSRNILQRDNTILNQLTDEVHM